MYDIIIHFYTDKKMYDIIIHFFESMLPKI